MSEQTKQQLLEFLDWAGQKGMMKNSTAKSIKAACNAVLAVLDGTESDNLLDTDLEPVFLRYENINSMNVSPSP